MSSTLKDRARCTATSKTTGNQCRNYPVPGAKTCRFHGSSTKRAKAKAARVVAEAAAAKAVVTLGLPVDVSPAEALLDEVRFTAGHVAWLRSRVQELETFPETKPGQDPHNPLVWGVTEESVSTGIEYGTKTIEKAAPSIWYSLYAAERKHLVDVCKAALAAGVDERRVQLAERQGLLLAQVIRGILDELGLSKAQQVLVGTVVPRHLRAIEAV